MTAIDDVRQKIDIIDVIGQYVTLRKAGRNFKALCPFHSEKTPSFIVFPEQGTWHCFGSCNTGGDVFSFLMKRENIDFGEALRRLAQRAGVELVREVTGEDASRKRSKEILALAAAHYHSLLDKHPAAAFAREYLVNRHVSAEMAALFQLGFAPNEWDTLKVFLAGKGYPPRDLEAAGLVIQGERGSHYDRFRGRLMFPIRNRTGEVTGFGARTLSGDEPKYLNSPQTDLFDKSATLYGLDLAREEIRSKNLAVIVEGYMDVIGAHQAGFRNVVASLGTALTDKQLALLKRLTKRYALALDPDAAGEEATKRGLQVAREALDRKNIPVPIGAGLIGFEQRLEAELLVIPMPAGQDPDELIHSDPQRWATLVENAEPLVEFYFRTAILDLDLKSPRDKSVAVQRLVPIIREIGDAVQRAHYIQRLARLVQVPEQTIALSFTGTRRTREQMLKREVAAPPPLLSAAGSKLEEYCLAIALVAPEQMSRIAFLSGDEFESPEYRVLFDELRKAVEQDELVDRDSFRAGLDPAFVPAHDQLIALGKSLPELTEPDQARELESTAYRLRLQHDRGELARLEVMLRDTDEDRSVEEERLLQERVSSLHKQIWHDQKTLSTLSGLRARG